MSPGLIMKEIIIIAILVIGGLSIFFQRVMNVGVLPVALDCIAVNMFYSAALIVRKKLEEKSAE